MNLEIYLKSSILFRKYIWIHVNPYRSTYVYSIPQTVRPHCRVLTVGVKARCSFQVVSGDSVTFAAQKFPCEMSMWAFRPRILARTGSRRPLFRRSRFTSASSPFFELCPFCVAGVALSGHFEVWNIVWRDRRRTSDTFSSAQQAWHFSVRCSNWEVLFFVACAVFGELGRHFKSVENFVKPLSNLISDMMMILCGRRSTLDVSGPFCVAGAILCRHCETWVKSRFWLFNDVLAQPFHRFVRVGSLPWGGAHFQMARATLSSLWACQFAIAVARCLFWNRSRIPLGTLGLSDRSHCGVVLIFRWLAQPCRHFGRVRSLSLWRSAHFDGQGDLVQRAILEIFLYRALL